MQLRWQNLPRITRIQQVQVKCFEALLFCNLPTVNDKEIPKGAPVFGANLVLSEGVYLSVSVCVDKSRYLCEGRYR